MPDVYSTLGSSGPSNRLYTKAAKHVRPQRYVLVAFAPLEADQGAVKTLLAPIRLPAPIWQPARKQAKEEAS